VEHFFRRVDTMLLKGVRPVLVFDGRKLAGKTVAAAQRSLAKLRAQALLDAQLDTAGRAALAAGTLEVEIDPRTLKAVASVTEELITLVIDRLRSAPGLAYVVAPYEADAQLAYLARTGKVQYVFSEDADLIAYGCPRVLLKVNWATGEADLFEQSSLTEATAASRSAPLPKLLRKWSDTGAEMLEAYCVLQGNDCVKLEGWGPARALAALENIPARKEYKGQPLPGAVIVAAMDRLAEDTGGLVVPDDAEAEIERGMAVYREQIVYDLDRKCDCPLSEAVRAHAESHADSSGHSWQHDGVAKECEDCGVMVNTWCTGCTACKLCNDRGVVYPCGEYKPPTTKQAKPVYVTLEDGTQLLHAEAHSLGFISRERPGEIIGLSAVTKLTRDAAHMPQHLTMDMVAGSVVNPELVTQVRVSLCRLQSATSDCRASVACRRSSTPATGRGTSARPACRSS
jgi:5'-3' exonuclease